MLKVLSWFPSGIPQLVKSLQLRATELERIANY
jgi:hypothetical protein